MRRGGRARLKALDSKVESRPRQKHTKAEIPSRKQFLPTVAVANFCELMRIDLQQFFNSGRALLANTYLTVSLGLRQVFNLIGSQASRPKPLNGLAFIGTVEVLLMFTVQA
jgi:hypothetical protein